MGKETSIGVGWTLHGDGTTHLISQPSAADIATLKEIEPSEARIYLIDAVVDGKHYSDVIAVGTMIVPHITSIDSDGLLHPILRLTLSPFYPTVISYITDYYVRTYKVKAYLVNLHRIYNLN
jgi:hypothetical protein